MTVFSKRRLGRKAAVAAGVVAAGVLAVPAPALAAYDAVAECGYTTDSDTGNSQPCGYAFFDSETGDGTERLTVSDATKDGWSVVVINYRYDLDDIGPYYAWVSTGSGTEKTWTLHIPENKLIDFQVCAGHNGGPDGITVLKACGSMVRGQA